VPSPAFRRKRRTPFLREDALSEGSELVLKKARPSASFGFLRLPSASFGFLRLPSESFTSGAFRRKRTCFEKSATFGFLNVLREASPLAASSRRTGFLREASPLALSEGSRRTCVLPKDGLPSGSFTSGAFRRKPKDGLSERPSGSFTSGGFLKEASPLAASFGKLHLWRFLKQVRFLNLFRFLRLPSESFTSGGVAAF